VTVTVPAQTVRADVKCVLKADRISLHVRTLPGDQQAVADGRLFQRIDADDSTWALESAAPNGSSRQLVLTLSKEKQMRWLQLMRAD
jgi:hypothetical protein